MWIWQDFCVFDVGIDHFREGKGLTPRHPQPVTCGVISLHFDKFLGFVEDEVVVNRLDCRNLKMLASRLILGLGLIFTGFDTAIPTCGGPTFGAGDYASGGRSAVRRALLSADLAQVDVAQLRRLAHVSGVGTLMDRLAVGLAGSRAISPAQRWRAVILKVRPQPLGWRRYWRPFVGSSFYVLSTSDNTKQASIGQNSSCTTSVEEWYALRESWFSGV